MDIKRKIVVIAGSACKLGYALAARLADEGARVVIADRNEAALSKMAIQTGAIPVVTNCRDKKGLKILVDKVISRFGRIDFFVSNMGMEGALERFLSPEERSHHWHRNILAQMYVAKYLLPFMIRAGQGYFINAIPAYDLFDEYHLPFYTTLKHPALHLAERLAENYKHSGIKVSVLCLYGVQFTGINSVGVAKMVMRGIRDEQFMIMPANRIQVTCRGKRRHVKIISGGKSKTAA